MKTQKLFNVKKIVSVGLTSCILLLVTNIANAQWTDNGSNISTTDQVRMESTSSPHISGGGGAIIGNVNSSHLSIDGNEIQRKSDLTSYGTLFLNYWGGDVSVAARTLSVIRATKLLGVDVISPQEKLDVNGGIKLGAALNTNAGTMQWDGTNFQGYNGTTWNNLDGSGAFTSNAGATKINNTTDDLLVGTSMTGAGYKMFFDAGKGAFRGGRLTASNPNDWDTDSLGSYSFGYGYNVKASGDFGATALGYFTTASGDNGATALGRSTSASGNVGATALGYQTTASGDWGATALGDNTIASGDDGATALGYYVTASGDVGATALGYQTTASGEDGATALGRFTTASGDDGATALGRSTTASGDDGATALGYYVTASGDFGATALGYQTTASGDDGATALGYYVTASGDDGATALGYYSAAHGDNGATALGNNCQANGNWGSIALGSGVVSNGDNGAIALGNDVQANSNTSIILGEGLSGSVPMINNIAKSLMVGFNSDIPTLFIGQANGVGTTGHVGIATTTPSEKLHINGGLRIAAADSMYAGTLQWNGSHFQGYNGSAWVNLDGESVWSLNGNKAFYNTGNVGIGTNNPAAKLHVTGDVAVAGSIIHPSDKNLKENIETIKNGLSLINQLNATTYSHKADKAEEFGLSTKPQFGLIAQEVEEVLPELVIQKALIGEDGTIYKGLDYEKLIPILVAALQESNTKVESQNEKIESQQNQINQILSELKLESASK